jgi:hypothetical protein
MPVAILILSTIVLLAGRGSPDPALRSTGGLPWSWPPQPGCAAEGDSSQHSERILWMPSRR